MTIQEAIHARHSIRKYIDKPIERELLEILRHAADVINTEVGLHIQLVVDEPMAFKGRMSYGIFSGVSNYFAMVAPKEDCTAEKVGYYGEQLVLLAQTINLSTCWVGVTFSKVKNAFVVNEDEKLYCLIALGYGNENGRDLKRKKVEQVSNADDLVPQWFRSGVEAALKAPTAVNQQKFHFEYIKPAENGSLPQVKATRGFSLIGYTKIDLGIAKYHFEIGAGKDNFEWK